MAGILIPGTTTQWEDIHIKAGNFAPKPKETPIDELEKAAIAIAEAYDPLEHKTVEELRDLEDDLQEDELAKYREARLQELKEKAKLAKFGTVQPLAKQDFIKQVNEAGSGIWVVIHLHEEAVQTSSLLGQHLARLATHNPQVKFLQGIASKIIENFPETQVPAVILYKDGECVKQLMGADRFLGQRMTKDIVEWVLYKEGVVETELDEDPREAAEMPITTLRAAKVKSRGRTDDSESDSDVDDRCYTSSRLGEVFKRR